MAAIFAPALGARATKAAEGLLAEFGSVSRIAAAPAEAIERALDGDARLAAMLDAGRVLVHFGMREVVLRERVNSTDPALFDYLLAKFAGMMEERLVVLFLDGQHKLISEDFFTSGSPDCLSLRPRALFGRALALGSRAIVLAHNHPSGDPTPSQKDIDATARITLDAEGLDITLIDHLVVGNRQVVSMKQAGLI